MEGGGAVFSIGHRQAVAQQVVAIGGDVALGVLAGDQSAVSHF